jgi:hypothetical protein
MVRVALFDCQFGFIIFQLLEEKNFSRRFNKINKIFKKRKMELTELQTNYEK